MKKHLYIFTVVLAAVSCVKGPEIIEEQLHEGQVTLQVSSECRQLEMSQDGRNGNVQFKTKGGAVILDVLTNQEEWTYETSGEDWLKLSADEYFLTLEADRNTAQEQRTATVIIKASNDSHEASVTLTVTQNHSGQPEISVEQNSLNFKAGVELRNTVEVETNYEDWSFDCTCSWLLLEKDGNSLVLTADPNKTTGQRIIDIELKAGEDSDWLRVSQDGTAFILLSTHNVATDDDGDTKIVVVESNPELRWNFTTDGSDWFTAESEGNELRISILPNPGGNERIGSVTVTVGDEDNNASARVNVRQIGPDTEELIYEVLIPEADYLLTGAPVITLSTGGSVTVDWGDGSEDARLMCIRHREDIRLNSQDLPSRWNSATERRSLLNFRVSYRGEHWDIRTQQTCVWDVSI